jgi:transcriptional repressor NrdR
VKCPFCTELENKVIDSRLSNQGAVIRRRRECLECSRRFTTYERVEETLPLVVKKDGRREPYRGQELPAVLKVYGFNPWERER